MVFRADFALSFYVLDNRGQIGFDFSLWRSERSRTLLELLIKDLLDLLGALLEFDVRFLLPLHSQLLDVARSILEAVDLPGLPCICHEVPNLVPMVDQG